MTDPENARDMSTGEYSLDEDDQLQPEDTLVDLGVDDALDEGYSPPESAPGGMSDFGAAIREQEEGETLDQLLAEEEPDPAAKLNEALDETERERSDEAEEEAEFPRHEEIGTARAGRLVAPDEGIYEDEESGLFASDVGVDGGAASAEEAAVHIIDEEDEVE